MSSRWRADVERRRPRAWPRRRCRRSPRPAARPARYAAVGQADRTTPSTPRLRSTISWAIRVTARRTSSAVSTWLRARKTPPLGGVGAFARADGRAAAARICSSSVRASRDPFHGRGPRYRRARSGRGCRRGRRRTAAPHRSWPRSCTPGRQRGHERSEGRRPGVAAERRGRAASSGVGRSLGAMADEHAVDEAARVVGREALGQLDGLVDDRPRPARRAGAFSS